MKISRRAEYALRALSAMAQRPRTMVSQIDELAKAEHIPMKFLEQIMGALKRAGLLRSRRGVGGGFQLERDPRQINVGEVLAAVDGPFQPCSCTVADPARAASMVCECGKAGGCGTGKVFTELQVLVNDFLGHISLADLAARGQRTDMHFEI